MPDRLAHINDRKGLFPFAAFRGRERGPFLAFGKAAFLALAAALVLAAPARADIAGWRQGTGYQYLLFGRYPQGAQGEEAPILWRVLENRDGILYVMSDRILDVRRIDGDQWNYPGWQESELYGWMNSDMLERAFSAQEREALHRDAELGWLSLPSAEDIRNPAYGFGDDRSRFFVGSDYAVAQGLYRYSGRSYSPIWTRTPSQKKHAHRSTKSGGKIGFIGVESDDIGLIPVAWIREDRVEIVSGMGSEALPYVLTVKGGENR